MTLLSKRLVTSLLAWGYLTLYVVGQTTVTPPTAQRIPTLEPTVSPVSIQTPTRGQQPVAPPTAQTTPTAAVSPTAAQTPTAATTPNLPEEPTVSGATEPPTTAATPTTAAQPTEPLPCFTSLTTLDEVERNVTDIEVVRNYVLCANTTFFTGFLTTNGDILGGDKPLTLRKNMHIYCGEIDGSSDNNCVVSRGSFGLTSIPNNFDPPTFNGNVIVQGVTFENAALYAVLIGQAGGFQFIDCIFSVSLTDSFRTCKGSHHF